MHELVRVDADVAPGSRAHAQAVLRAQDRLRAAVGPQVAGDGPLVILLFLFAEGGGPGVGTAACCAAAPAPRTTALRWITALANAGLVVQRTDEADRRVTLLDLTERAEATVRDWLLTTAGASPA